MSLWLGLVACAPPPDRLAYTTALHEPALEPALRACVEVRDAELRGDCEVSVRARFNELGDCVGLEGRWQAECHFLAAERLARRGRFEDALARCTGSAYAANCELHIMGMLATESLDLEMAEVDRQFDELSARLVSRGSGREYWRAWFRGRIMRDLAVDPAWCLRAHCISAAWMEIEIGAIHHRGRVGAEAWCAGETVPTWASGEVVPRLLAAADAWCSAAGREDDGRGAPDQRGFEELKPPLAPFSPR